MEDGLNVHVDREDFYSERGRERMFAIDINLLVYDHNEDSEFNEKEQLIWRKL